MTMIIYTTFPSEFSCYNFGRYQAPKARAPHSHSIIWNTVLVQLNLWFWGALVAHGSFPKWRLIQRLPYDTSQLQVPHRRQHQKSANNELLNVPLLMEIAFSVSHLHDKDNNDAFYYRLWTAVTVYTIRGMVSNMVRKKTLNVSRMDIVEVIRGHTKLILPKYYLLEVRKKVKHIADNISIIFVVRYYQRQKRIAIDRSSMCDDLGIDDNSCKVHSFVLSQLWNLSHIIFHVRSC